LILRFLYNFAGTSLCSKANPHRAANLVMISRPPADALPPLKTTRWVARRKALLIAAVRDGRITLEEARRRYALSIEEFLLWQRAIESAGLAGLRVSAGRGERKRKRGRTAKAPPPSPGAEGETKKSED
jgi:Protein of unknown function (DUF1153)